MSTLYPAKVNSPVTELSAAIDAAATTITVLNGNALPDAPNIATIGQGDTAETIQYGGKTGNTLSDVVRGFEGTARSWTSGTKIARNFTAYDYDTIRTKLDEGQTIPAPIVRGANVITATQASGATFKVLGCSLCNILGRDGGCESLTGWTTLGTVATSTTQVKSGTNSFKVTTVGSGGFLNKNFSYALDTTKQYVFGAWVFVESWTSGIIGLRIQDIDGTDRYSANANSATIGSWQFVYVKIPTSHAIVGSGFRLTIGSGATMTWTAYFDSLRIYEVTAAEYAAIGTTITGEAIDRRWPYVDSVQHTQGLSVMMPGKNLLPGLFSNPSGDSASFGPYDHTLNMRTNPHSSSQGVSVGPNVTQVSFSCEITGPGYMYLGATNAAGTSLGLSTALNASTRHITFTLPVGTVRIVTRLELAANAASTNFKNWMLVIGDATNLPASFEPNNPQYAHAPIKLASNVDRTIADSYDSATQQVFRRYVIDIKLDGSLAWAHYANTNTDTVEITAPAPVTGVNWTSVVRTYSGEIFPSVVGLNQLAPSQLLATNGTNIFLRLRRADTGWVSAVIPNTNSIKALMNGWLAAGNNGTVYNSWVSILTGAAPATNTEAYVAANKAPGWDAYATLDYVRATPITETLTGDLGALVTVKGGNAVELLEGVIVRERVYPYLSSGLYGINRYNVSAKTTRRIDRLLAVYKGVNKDHGWTIGAHTVDTAIYGNQWATIPAADYDPAAEYYVDYIVLDKYLYTTNAVDATLVYQSTLGGAVAQSTQDIAVLKQHNGIQDWQLMLDEAYAANLRMDLDNLSASTMAAAVRNLNNIRALSQGGMV